MKQLLFLLLFPCLALAQYPGNANQKITLGEQTTADGLVYRGVAYIDTVTATSKITRANKQDTSAYLLLDTVTNLLWHYKTASNGWIQAGGGVSVSSFSAGSTGLTPSEAITGAVTLGGTLAVANGGTGQTSLAAAGINTGSGTLNYLPKYTATGTTLGNSIIFDNGSNVGIGNTNPNEKLDVSGNISIKASTGTKIGFNTNDAFSGYSTSIAYQGISFGFSTTPLALSGYYGIGLFSEGAERMLIAGNGNVGIGTASPAVQFHTTGAVRFATFAGGGTTTLDVDNTGNLARTSSIELKKDVTPINYGLNQILQINPINFNWIDEDKYGNENENGFIAEDVMNVIPNVVGSDTHGLFMDYTKLIPILTKAIQEQNVLIKALEQRILILENK